MEDGPPLRTVRYALAQRASVLEVDATLFAEVRTVNVPIRFGVTAGFAQPAP